MFTCAFCTVHVNLYSSVVSCVYLKDGTRPAMAIGPAETKIAGKLREKLRALEAQPHQLLREFQHYKDLIKRLAISKELLTEGYCSYILA